MAKKKTPETVSDLVFDDKNFNKGNPFGEGLIEKSFSKFGAGRGILVDRNNRPPRSKFLNQLSPK